MIKKRERFYRAQAQKYGEGVGYGKNTFDEAD